MLAAEGLKKVSVYMPLLSCCFIFMVKLSPKTWKEPSAKFLPFLELVVKQTIHDKQKLIVSKSQLVVNRLLKRARDNNKKECLKTLSFAYSFQFFFCKKQLILYYLEEKQLFQFQKLFSLPHTTKNHRIYMQMQLMFLETCYLKLNT